MIKNVRIYGLYESMIASSYPMLAEELSEEEFTYEVANLQKHIKACEELHKADIKIKDVEDLELQKAYRHFRRCLNLGNAKEGSGHDCFSKGVRVQLDLTATHVFLLQFMRYHYQDTVSLT